MLTLLLIVLAALGLLVQSAHTIQADAVVLLTSAEPLTATVSVAGRNGEHTLSLDGDPIAVSIPRIHYCSGTRFAREPLPPPLVNLHLMVGAESYRLHTYGHESRWYADAGDSTFRLDIGTIAQREDRVWVLPVHFERAAPPAGHRSPPVSSR